MLGFQEVVLILAILLIVFGPTKLPEIARALGGAMREFNNAGKALAEAVESPLETEMNKVETTPKTVLTPNPTKEEKPINQEHKEVNAEKQIGESPKNNG